MEKLLGFHGPAYFLSNFYPAEVTLDNVKYPTVEHAYQASKILNTIRRKIFLNCTTPAKAKQFGNTEKLRRSRELREDWEEVKLKVMYELVKEKFAVHPNLKTALLETGDTYLEETNWWGDTFWGVCNGVGQNELGKILMRVRQELKNENNT